MNKTFIVIGVVVIVLVGAALMWKLFLSPVSPAPVANNTTTTTSYSSNSYTYNGNANTSGSSTQTPSTTPSLAQVVLTNKAIFKDPLNKFLYYLGYHPYEGVTDPTASKNPPYVIQYDVSSQNFSIALYQEPISQTRAAAEQYLMQTLGLTQDQMCALNYDLGVPYSVNTIYAGENLGFSFCPGAVQLPN